MKGFFAIEKEASVVEIVYNSTPDLAVRNLYGNSDFAGPFKTEKAAETAIKELREQADCYWANRGFR